MIAHESLEILGVIGEGVHKNDGDGDVQAKFTHLQNSLRGSHIRHLPCWLRSEGSAHKP